MKASDERQLVVRVIHKGSWVHGPVALFMDQFSTFILLIDLPLDLKGIPKVPMVISSVFMGEFLFLFFVLVDQGGEEKILWKLSMVIWGRGEKLNSVLCCWREWLFFMSLISTNLGEWFLLLLFFMSFISTNLGDSCYYVVAIFRSFFFFILLCSVL